MGRLQTQRKAAHHFIFSISNSKKKKKEEEEMLDAPTRVWTRLIGEKEKKNP